MVFYLKIMSVSLNISLIGVIGYTAIIFPIPHIISMWPRMRNLYWIGLKENTFDKYKNKCPKREL